MGEELPRVKILTPNQTSTKLVVYLCVTWNTVLPAAVAYCGVTDAGLGERYSWHRFKCCAIS